MLKLIFGGFELSSSEISNDNTLSELINKVDDVSRVLSLLSGEEIELANKINDKAENLKITINSLNELAKSDFSSYFGNIIALNDYINKVLRDAVEMELMFQSKLDSLNDKFVPEQNGSSKTHAIKTISSSNIEDIKKDT